MLEKRRSTDFAHCKALLSHTTSVTSPPRRHPLTLLPPPAARRASFVVASEQRLPAKDDGRAALRHRLRIKILLTAESEFHFKVEFNYIRACLPTPYPPVSLFLPVAPSVCPVSLFPPSSLPFPFSLLAALLSHFLRSPLLVANPPPPFPASLPAERRRIARSSLLNENI